MLQIATIGTSWITDQFIDAVQHHGSYHLRSVYSRDLAKAKAYAQAHGADQGVDSLEELWKDQALDIVYIASPNSLHFQQAKAAILAGKHVIVEKPLVTRLEQWEKLFTLAQGAGVYVFEAVRHMYYKNYQALKDLLSAKYAHRKHPFLGANFSIGQYSSKYDTYQQGEELPNVFNNDFEGGSLYDMGVYPLYVAVDLFGKPLTATLKEITDAKGIDLYEHYFLDYADFYVTIFVSKAVHSLNQSEIYLDDEVVRISDITNIDRVEVHQKDGGRVSEIAYPVRNWMDDEVAVFADILQNPGEVQTEKYQALTQLSRQVLEVMETLKGERT